MFSIEPVIKEKFRANSGLLSVRKRRHLTVRQCAEKLEISPAYYCRIETGQIAISEELADKIRKLLMG